MAVTGLWPAGRGNTVASGHWVLTDLRILKQARGHVCFSGGPWRQATPESPPPQASACLTLEWGQAWCPETRQETVVLLVAPGSSSSPSPVSPLVPSQPPGDHRLQGRGADAAGFTWSFICLCGGIQVDKSVLRPQGCLREGVGAPRGPTSCFTSPSPGSPPLDQGRTLHGGQERPWWGECLGDWLLSPVRSPQGPGKGFSLVQWQTGLQFQQGTLEPQMRCGGADTWPSVWSLPTVPHAVRFTFRGPLPKRGLKQSMFLAQHLL